MSVGLLLHDLVVVQGFCGDSAPLDGVHVVSDGSRLRLMATDRYTLVTMVFDWTGPVFETTLSKNGVKSLVGALRQARSKKDKELAFTLDHEVGALRVSIPSLNVSVGCDTLDSLGASFPPVLRLIPDETSLRDGWVNVNPQFLGRLAKLDVERPVTVRCDDSKQFLVISDGERFTCVIVGIRNLEPAHNLRLGGGVES